MEILLRCQIPDVPGMLATHAGAIAETGGDIQAVEVVETAQEMAIDDLWVVTSDIASLVSALEAMQGVSVIHAGLSRGVPGDATARLATGIDTLMSGAMPVEDGLATLMGGLLRAASAEILPDAEWPSKKDRRQLALRVASGVLVLRREYKFLDVEIQRAHQVLAVCERAAAIAGGS